MIKYHSIGRILKPYRNDGTLLALIDQQYHTDIVRAKALFIRINGQNVPFFAEEIETENDLTYIKFEEFNGPEDVKPLNGYDVLIMETDIKDPRKKNVSAFNYDELNGYIIFDQTSGNNIPVRSIEQYPQQLMAIGILNNKEVFIPLIENFIEEIDDEKKIIKMTLPEGILNL